MKSRFLLLVFALAACKFPELPPIDEDARGDAGPGDGATARHTLTLTIDGAGSGSGSISVEPGGFTCSSSTCTRMYDAGTQLTITVSAASTLDGVVSVAGDCTASPCSVAMEADRTVTARFVRYACVPNSASCTANALTQCDANGNFVTHMIPNGAADGSPTTITMQNYACPMGCHANEQRCADITLGNGVEAAMDTVEVSPTGLDIVLPAPGAPSGTVQITTNDFNASQGLIRVTDTDGNPVDIPAQLVNQGGDAGTLLVLKTRTFSLRAGSTLRAIGTHKLGIAANFDVFIAGTLDLGGRFGASYEPGAGVSAVSGCFGAMSPTTAGATGGGASACSGGASSTGLAGGLSSATQAPFVMAGCGGGRTSAVFAFPSPPGGGLLLASRTKVVVASTSVVDLTGSQGGANGTYAQGGAAGGNTVLMAPSIRVDSGAVVSARGGSGSAANGTMGVQGSRGPLTGTSPAFGATCSGCGTGGAGGYEEPGGWCNGTVGTGSGSAIAGGGGSVGRCVAYARPGAASVASGAMKCLYNLNALQVR
jgi:hypothetical protein